MDAPRVMWEAETVGDAEPRPDGPITLHEASLTILVQERRENFNAACPSASFTLSSSREDESATVGRLLFAMWLMSSAAAFAQAPDDAAHRADRAAVRQLNGGVMAQVARRDAADQAKFDRYRAASAEYQRALDSWRRQAIACEHGDSAACAPQ
ncbi:MAG: hypothetical protein JOY99_16190 [Sphingomonadaceae bacterium]|nr:hypothetical protein [Sphingomonadaceae bacterium]